MKRIFLFALIFLIFFIGVLGAQESVLIQQSLGQYFFITEIDAVSVGSVQHVRNIKTYHMGIVVKAPSIKTSGSA